MEFMKIRAIASSFEDSNTLEESSHPQPPTHVDGFVVRSVDRPRTSKAKRKKNSLPCHALKILEEWLNNNLDDPYPSKAEKEYLSQSSDLTFKQVSNWFINARVRKLQFQNQKKKFSSKIQRKLSLKESIPFESTSKKKQRPLKEIKFTLKSINK